MRQADTIWALGGYDLRVAEPSGRTEWLNRVAELWYVGMGPRVVMSGGLANFTEGVFMKSEADLFAEWAMELGAPKDKILIENLSTRMGENVLLTQRDFESIGC